MTTLWPWVAFNAAVLALLAVDLGLFNRTPHVVSAKEAGLWSGVWIVLALGFAAGLYCVLGRQAGTEFLAGYLIEYSLSVDNIFVIVLIFSYFAIQGEYQHRVLFWGIIGALLMRGAMIGAGAVLIQRFEWVTYVFGLFLVGTGLRLGFGGEHQVDPAHNPVLRLLRRVVPVCTRYDGQKFFLRKRDSRGVRRTMATPLFVVLILIETMDLVFAVDSVPAVFAVTRVPFIVYTSNVCAILGLRSLYFLLAGVVHRLRFLRVGLAVLLAFVGAKMVVAIWYTIPTLISLVVIVGVLVVTVGLSLIFSDGGAPPLSAGERS